MEKIKHHYCWLKVSGSVDATVNKSVDAGADVGADDMLAVLLSTVPKPGPAWSGTSILSTPVPVPAYHRPRGVAMSEPARMADRVRTPSPNSTPVPVPAAQHVADDDKQTTTPVPTAQRMGSTPWQTTPPVPTEARMAGVGLEHSTPIPAPPKSAAALSSNGRGASTSMPATSLVAPGPAITDLMFAGATFAGAWQFERPGEDVGIGLRMQWQPVLGGHDAALAWRDSPEGRAWCADAKDLLLVSFVAVGEL